jgi:two-component system, NarL family, sensor histidine kinase DevS
MSDVASGTASVRVFEALDTATRAVAGLLSVDAVLQVIVDEVRPLVGAQYAALGIVDELGLIERFITSGLSDEERERIGSLPRGHGLLGLIIQENRAVRVPDLNVDPRRYGFPPNHPPMTTFLGVPVAVKGRSVGNLYLTNKDGGAPFTEGDEDLVGTFARHAGIAIENARLHEQVRTLAVRDERVRIGQDLHDGIIQNLYAVSLSLEDVPELMDEDRDEVLRRVERAIVSLHGAIGDIRNFIFDLRPDLLGGLPLSAGLLALADEFQHNTMIDIEVRDDGSGWEPAGEVTAHILGIVNEALSNAARHAGASRVWVDASRGPGESLVVTVRDNGHGFDVSTGAALGHQGLANMRSRATGIGAMLEVASDPGSGTAISVVVPAAGDR